MEVVQATFGVFHSFELARQLEQRGMLRRIYTTWPWRRVQREGLERRLVRTFPAVHTADYLLGRSLGSRGMYPAAAAERMKRWTATSFDRWVCERLASGKEECEVLVGLSGFGLRAGAVVQGRGGIFVCDRGSTHHRFQEMAVREEHARWRVEHRAEADGVIERDEAIYGLADAITVPSRFAARTFMRMGVPEAKLRVIPYGVRLERFFPEGRLPAVRERLEVVFAGQVSLRKGVPYLLEAFARVRHPAKRLRVVGAMDARLREILGRFPLEGVEFQGALPQERLREIFSTSHVLVLPSLEEGLALVQAQAMACGCPVLASTNTGAEDLFTDGVEGFIVPVRDVEAMTERMERLADEPGLRERMAAAALARVQRMGGWDAYGERWAALLGELSGVG
jgi:starch synthase